MVGGVQKTWKNDCSCVWSQNLPVPALSLFFTRTDPLPFSESSTTRFVAEKDESPLKMYCPYFLSEAGRGSVAAFPLSLRSWPPFHFKSTDTAEPEAFLHSALSLSRWPLFQFRKLSETGLHLPQQAQVPDKMSHSPIS